ncbi:MAG TPA: hypothetical protein VEU31_07515 [Candidatus Acidoferrales bacterium]|nr:hypothetical protein [Candidatus Acidoferrales bacterium]
MDDVLVAVMVTVGMLTISVFLALVAEWVCLEGAFRLMALAPSRNTARANAEKPRPASTQAPAFWR